MPIKRVYYTNMQEKTLMFDHANHLTLNQVKDDPTKSLTVLEHVATTFLKPHV